MFIKHFAKYTFATSELLTWAGTDIYNGFANQAAGC